LKLLLTSGGVTNTSIRDALVDLLGKPIDDSSALCIPTAEYGHPWCTPASAWRFIAGQGDFGWKSVGVLELTALSSIGEERWVPWVREADVLLVDGGDATYLCHWLRESGLVDILPTLPETVWIGVSAGSVVMTPRIGDDFVMWPAATDDRTLGLVDFSIFPHLETLTCRGTRWPPQRNGRPTCRAARTRSMTRRRSKLSTAALRSSPRDLLKP
jgi:dipeptidase E